MALEDTSKNCPKCGLTNPSTAIRCDCGYRFDGATQSTGDQANYYSMSWPLFIFCLIAIVVLTAIWGALVVDRIDGLLPPGAFVELIGYLAFALGFIGPFAGIVVVIWLLRHKFIGPPPRTTEGKLFITKWIAIVTVMFAAMQTIISVYGE